jgi:hypothetical protein
MPKSRASVYLDTNIFSLLHYSEGHVESLAQNLRTREWWTRERHFFQIHSSRWTVEELRDGVYRAQSKALAEARRYPFLAKTAAVDECAELYLKKGLVPQGKLGDAIQLALASVHQMDYLLTWNYAHLANVRVQHVLEDLHRDLGWRTPWLVSPDTIPWQSLGNEIKRKTS